MFFFELDQSFRNSNYNQNTVHVPFFSCACDERSSGMVNDYKNAVITKRVVGFNQCTIVSLHSPPPFDNISTTQWNGQVLLSTLNKASRSSLSSKDGDNETRDEPFEFGTNQ